MLAFALRRAIWAIPTLFGVSLVVFLLTTLLPEPAPPRAALEGDVAARLSFEDARRARFLDLPRLLNLAPRDVRSHVDDCVAHVVADDADAPLCRERLAVIGGAALPHLLPRLDEIPPAERGRLARALAPIARRMGVGEEAELTDSDKATLFWKRFWEDRSVDFTEPAVRRAVARLALRGTELREQELRYVDTFALKELMAALRTTRDPGALARLTQLAAHVTGRGVVLQPDADRATARSAISAWLSWWYVHETDYVTLEGGEKLTASLAQTRYAKWVLGAVTGRLGLSTRDGAPILDKLVARAPITLGMALAALLLAAAVAVPLGVLSAWRRGQTVDHVVALLVVAVHAMPTFLVAELLAWVGGGAAHAYVLPAFALATVSLAVMTQAQRTAMIDALARDYVRAARAKGARTLRVAIVHALRNALVPTATIAGVQFPALVGGAFVVEEVFDVHGIGWETLRAIEARDVAWIVAVTLLCAVGTTACLVATDIAYGLLDPRVRESQTRRRAA